MVRRLQPTLMDYVVIAINPALIMVLIGSLVYFLLEMFYQGQYPERLHFCLTMFIFAAVLISRISMEEGWERAAPFGAALAIVIAMAMHQFVKYEGSQWATIGWMINYALIALIWWCAIQLTWDCTLIDETQDASGEGLLQAVGLDGEGTESDAEKTADSDALQEQKETKLEARKDEIEQQPSDRTGKQQTPTNDRKFEDDMAWSMQKKSAKKPVKASSGDEKSWWDKFLERRRKPHAPGVWVVYFSLAALPIFGLGQAFIPTSNAGSRRYTFVLLCVYVTTGLGLLMTTSFLGLRRYLRQRRLEMPLPMAGTWLVTGTVLIVCLLVVSMLLPRPNAEYAISQLPLSAGSAEHQASQLSVGKEGTRDAQAKDSTGERSRPENEKTAADENQHGSQGAHSSEGKSTTGGQGQAKEGVAKSGGSQSGDGKSSDAQSKGKGSSSAKSGNEQSSGSQTAESQNQQQREPNQSQQESSQSQAEAPPPQETPSTPDLSFVSESFSALLKWIFYGAVIVLAVWWAWRHWGQLLSWLQALLSGWHDLWGMFGRKEHQPKEVVQLAPRHKSFYDFANPFASGAVGQLSAAELVRYSFEALEAWARDNGWPRETDQTAYEFARLVGSHAEDVAKPARALAELYSRAAYAPGTLPPASVEHLRALWDVMRERQAVGF